MAFQPQPAASSAKPSAFLPSNQFPCFFSSDSTSSPYFETQFDGDSVATIASPQVISPENNELADNLFQNTGEYIESNRMNFDIYRRSRKFSNFFLKIIL